MQIDGVQINPREWWDEHWIHDRILSKLEPEAAGSSHASSAEPAAHAAAAQGCQETRGGALAGIAP